MTGKSPVCTEYSNLSFALWRKNATPLPGSTFEFIFQVTRERITITGKDKKNTKNNTKKRPTEIIDRRKKYLWDNIKKNVELKLLMHKKTHAHIRTVIEQKRNGGLKLYPHALFHVLVHAQGDKRSCEEMSFGLAY